jgi:hypothetical protein
MDVPMYWNIGNPDIVELRPTSTLSTWQHIAIYYMLSLPLVRTGSHSFELNVTEKMHKDTVEVHWGTYLYPMHAFAAASCLI